MKKIQYRYQYCSPDNGGLFYDTKAKTLAGAKAQASKQLGWRWDTPLEVHIAYSNGNRWILSKKIHGVWCDL